jgi:hypothetical protein
MRIGPGFLAGLMFVFVVAPAVACLFVPDVGGPGSVENVVRYQMSQIAAAFGKHTAGAGVPPGNGNDLIFHPLKGKDISCGCRTNKQGEVLDVWGTPYQVKVEAPSKFVIRSAGEDGQFGDGDDIVYDSSTARFVSHE